MMNKLEVDIPHRLTRDEARSRIGLATERLARDYSAVCAWDADGRLLVQRKGLAASLRIADDRVSVALELGVLLRPFAGSIQAGISKQLADILA